MGEINRHKRQIALRIKRAKREKIHRLMKKLRTADLKDRSRLVEKIRRIAPFARIPGETPGGKSS